MKKNNTNTILFFLLIIMFLVYFLSLFLSNKREIESFLAPGTQEGGAQWDGKAWNYITRNRSSIPEIDLNTHGAILGEMNQLQLLPSFIDDNLTNKSTSFKVKNMRRPIVRQQRKINPFIFPKNPFQPTVFKNSSNSIRNIFQPNNQFQQQQKTWNSIFQR